MNNVVQGIEITVLNQFFRTAFIDLLRDHMSIFQVNDPVGEAGIMRRLQEVLK